LIGAESSDAGVPAPRALLGLGGAFLCAMGIICVLVLKNASTDAAEQLLWTQTLQAGYGIQPPLYTWLKHLVFSATGVSFPALVFTKELLLGLTGVMMFLAARRISRDETIAGSGLEEHHLAPLDQETRLHAAFEALVERRPFWFVIDRITRADRHLFAVPADGSARRAAASCSARSVRMPFSGEPQSIRSRSEESVEGGVPPNVKVDASSKIQ